MTDLWISKNRVYWEKDAKYLIFQGRLCDYVFEFEDVWIFCKMDYIKFDDEFDIDFIKEKWLKLLQMWRKWKKKGKSALYEAIIALYLSLPYQNIVNIEVFNQFDIAILNTAYYYNYYEYIKFEGYEEMNMEDFPSIHIFNKWLNDKYKESCWWIIYRVYERLNNLPYIIESESTKKIED